MRTLSREQTLEQIKVFGKLNFTVTEDHLKLLPHLNINFNQWFAYEGAPGVDEKRPYGNSDVWGDIHEILTDQPHWDEETDEDNITDELYDRYKRLHEEMATVLLICAQNNGVELGNYVAAKYFREWIKDD